MTELNLPDAMAEARPGLADLAQLGAARVPYFSVQLSSRQGMSILVDNREERITEREPTAGSVLSVFDGATTFERAVGGFRQEELRHVAQDFLDELTVQHNPLP